MLTTFDYSNKTFKNSKTTEIHHFKSENYGQKVLKLCTPFGVFTTNKCAWAIYQTQNKWKVRTVLFVGLRRIRFSCKNHHNAIIIVANISIINHPLGHISSVIETLSCRLSSFHRLHNAGARSGVGDVRKTRANIYLLEQCKICCSFKCIEFIVFGYGCVMLCVDVGYNFGQILP